MTAPEVEQHATADASDRVAARLFDTWARDSALGLSSLSPAIAGAQTPVSPQLARSAQVTENAWCEVEEEFGLLTSTEAAERMGYAVTALGPLHSAGPGSCSASGAAARTATPASSSRPR